MRAHGVAARVEVILPAIMTDFMPLAGSPTGPLTTAEKAALLGWLERGAPPEPQRCPAGT
jgi:hypothetical protein